MKANFRPELLKWARDRAHLSPAELAKKLGVKEEKVIAWEQTGEMTLRQAENLADATHIPFGYLLLQTPPIETLPVQDFRTVGSTGIEGVTPELLDTVNEALRRQDWYRDYLIENDASPLPFVGSLDTSASTSDAALLIGSVIKWGAERRSRVANWEVALEEQIDAIEDAGILVMQNSVVGQNNYRPLHVRAFRGFVLCDKYAPLIFLNSRDSKAARMFTLAHEVVHIWLGESGVSNPWQTAGPSSTTSSTEKFCNAVAAELLVPEKEIRTTWAEVRSQSEPIKRLTRHFKVSSLVIIRRLWDVKIFTDEQFQQMYSDELSEISKVSTDKESGGGNYYYTLRSRLGKRFSSALVQSTLEGATRFRDAFDLSGLKSTKTFDEFVRVVTGANP